MIGDPPNVIIGSKVGLTFNQFLFNLTPPILIIFIVVLVFIWMTNRDQFKPINTNIIKLFTFMNNCCMIIFWSSMFIWYN